MEKPVYLETDLPENKGLDFDFLRAEGIRLIQQLTGQFWTDFNEHDPGVTILEQVAYALTEVSFKSQFDIADLLHSDSDNERSFFKPNEVLPSNPLTVNDFRKILFDSVFDIKNVWISPMQDDGSNIEGQFRILIDTADHVSSKEAKEAAKKSTVKAYNAVRNLCEDIGSIDIVKHQEIGLSVDIEVSGSYTPEEVIARVYYEIDNFLCPEIKFYSLEELIEEGYHLNDIFNGPLLKHGFIKTEDLPTKTERILVSEIMKIIMQVEGVSSVKNLKLLANGKEFDNQIILEENELPKLKAVEKHGQSNHEISIYKGDIPYNSVNNEDIKRLINELKSKGRRVYRLNETNIQAPAGQEVNIADYYSVQNQFPAIYGIGEEGVSNKQGIRRKAQANQLKGYLLLFEQVIANALAQLANVKDLLSFKGDFDKSYFTQELNNVPDVEPLLKQLKGQETNTIISPNDELTESYKEGLPQILSYGEDKFDRIQRLLDYLLALHGEEFNKSLRQFNYYFDDMTFELFLNKTKAHFLRRIPEISSAKSKGYDYTDNEETESNISGLELKLSLLLGFHSIQIEGVELQSKYKSILNVFQKYDLSLEQESFDEDEVLFVPEDIIKDRFEIVDDEEVDWSDLSKEDKDELLNRSIYLQKKSLTPEILFDGLNIENYRIGTMDEATKSITVAFFSRPHDQWLVLARFRSAIKAEQFVMIHRDLICKLNMSCEGLHLIEHILLRPEYEEQKFGLYILNEQGERMLGSEQTFTYDERIKMMEEVDELLNDPKSYSVEIDENRDFKIFFKSEKLNVSFESITPDPSVEKTHKDLKELILFLRRESSRANKFDYFIRHSNKSPRIPEDFFSHQLSIMFPDWTARFRDEEYRRVTEEIIYKERPASVEANVHWLSFDKYKVFEKLALDYYKLKSELGEEAHLSDEYNNTVESITNILFDIDVVVSA